MKNILVWGKSETKNLKTSKVNNLISVEDGFIRSIGFVVLNQVDIGINLKDIITSKNIL